MRERPILFSAPMIRAILAGQKTQTRRVLRDQDPIDLGAFVHGAHLSRRPVFDKVANAVIGHRLAAVHCPYGVPGDRLWVRETFYCDNAFYPDGVGVEGMWRTVEGKRVPVPVDEQRKVMLDEDMYYRADGEPDFEGAEGPTPWRPSIHMPRWASRITLEITGVRVERLQAISDADARAEGVERIDTEFGMCLRTPQWRAYGNEDTQYCISPEASFRTLWSSINGRESWDANPWVWVVEFKRLEADHA
jgi:hypothetical protein